MFTESRLIASALVCLALLSAAPALQAQEIPVEDDFSQMELSWSGRGQVTTYRGVWKAILDEKGDVVICGVGQYLDSTSAQATSSWLHTVYIKVGDVKIMKDMSFFNKIPSSGDLKTAKAKCKSSGKALPKGVDSVSMGWPPGQAKF